MPENAEVKLFVQLKPSAVEEVLKRWQTDQHPYMTVEIRQLIDEIRNALFQEIRMKFHTSRTGAWARYEIKVKPVNIDGHIKYIAQMSSRGGSTYTSEPGNGPIEVMRDVFCQWSGYTEAETGAVVNPMPGQSH